MSPYIVEGIHSFERNMEYLEYSQVSVNMLYGTPMTIESQNRRSALTQWAFRNALVIIFSSIGKVSINKLQISALQSLKWKVFKHVNFGNSITAPLNVRNREVGAGGRSMTLWTAVYRPHLVLFHGLPSSPQLGWAQLRFLVGLTLANGVD